MWGPTVYWTICTRLPLRKRQPKLWKCHPRDATNLGERSMAKDAGWIMVLASAWAQREVWGSIPESPWRHPYSARFARAVFWALQHWKTTSITWPTDTRQCLLSTRRQHGGITPRGTYRTVQFMGSISLLTKKGSISSGLILLKCRGTMFWFLTLRRQVIENQ